MTWKRPYDPERSVSQGFGVPYPDSVRRLIPSLPPTHTGIDIPMPVGTPLYAVKNGVISYTDKLNDANGMGLTLTTGNEKFLYWHVSSIAVSPGEAVRMGQVIALSGNTGYSSGPHVHFELWVNGVLTDPSPYLQEGGVDVITEKLLDLLYYFGFFRPADQGGKDTFVGRPFAEVIEALDRSEEHKRVADAYTIELPKLRERVATEHQRTQVAIDVAVTAATGPLELELARLRNQPPKAVTDLSKASALDLLKELIRRLFREEVISE